MSRPAYGSEIVLKTNAAAGAAGSDGERLGRSALSGRDGLERVRGREEVLDLVEELLDAGLVAAARREEHGRDLALLDRLLESRLHLLFAEVALREERLHELVVALGDHLDEPLVQLGRVGGELLGDRAGRGLARVVREPALHGDEVDDAAEALLLADRGLHGHAGPAELLLELVHDAAAVGALAVHAVDDDESGEPEVLAGLPGLFGLDLDARDRVDDDERRVRGAQAAEHLRDEDSVARRVDQVDLLLLPLERRDREPDRDLPVDLLGVEVCRRVAFLDAAEPRRGAGLVEQRGDERRLSDAVVPHDGDVVDGGRGINLHEPSDPRVKGR